MSENVVVRQLAPNTSEFFAVRNLGDQNARAMGHLGFEAWSEYATSGGMLGVFVDGHLAGYTIFRTPRREVRIAHLIIKPEFRGRGLARRLVEEVRSRNPDRIGIGLRCRRDYAATNLWPKLGFVSLSEKVARTPGEYLVEWWLDFGLPNLFSWEPRSQAVHVLADTNIFLDLYEPVRRSTSPRTRTILHDLEDQVELVYCREIATDLLRDKVQSRRDALRKKLDALLPMEIEGTQIANIANVLRAAWGSVALSVQDESDVRFAAYAVAAGIPILVTSDRKAREKLSEVLLSHFGITMCSVGELPAVVQKLHNASLYSPRNFREGGYSLQEESTASQVVTDFFSNASHERKRDMAARVDSVLSAKPNSGLRVLRDPQGTSALALGYRWAPGGEFSVQLVRMKADLSLALRVTIAAQAVQLMRELCVSLGCAVMTVEDPFVPLVVRQAMRNDGFFHTGDAEVGIALDGVATRAELQMRVKQALENSSQTQASLARNFAAKLTDSAFNVERMLWPVCIDSDEIPCWLVPVHPAFSADLLGYPLILTQRSDDLSLSLDHVYYKKQRAGECAPGRILWYATEPESCCFAISHLTEVVDATPDDLHRDFARLGVYGIDQVREMADPKLGLVRALRFSGTRMFDRPVSLDAARDIVEHNGGRITFPGSSLIDHRSFSQIAQKGF